MLWHRSLYICDINENRQIGLRLDACVCNMVHLDMTKTPQTWIQTTSNVGDSGYSAKIRKTWHFYAIRSGFYIQLV